MRTLASSGEKSYVGLEQKVCCVCAQPYDTGTVLLDRRLRSSLHHHELTGWGLCPEHLKLYNDGYIALVGAVNKSGKDRLDQADADRTGVICHLRKAVALEIFGSGFPVDRPMVFAEPALIEKIQVMAEVQDG